MPEIPQGDEGTCGTRGTDGSLGSRVEGSNVQLYPSLHLPPGLMMCFYFWHHCAHITGMSGGRAPKGLVKISFSFSGVRWKGGGGAGRGDERNKESYRKKLIIFYLFQWPCLFYFYLKVVCFPVKVSSYLDDEGNEGGQKKRQKKWNSKNKLESKVVQGASLSVKKSLLEMIPRNGTSSRASSSISSGVGFTFWGPMLKFSIGPQLFPWQ